MPNCRRFSPQSMGYHVNCAMSAREAASVATNASTASLRLA
ncbi:hypothetical protein PC116_g20847 [Phytophthora cactorum]|nr:hypothetical protein PC114_g19378 [Phytophthora cactorum]KAG2997475.1 hypothetical protein PC119_g17674 [Phytophthora cactorum]KAG3188004.1 hypothetical protein PC128_g12377 [Phytophthora cactorum]KAG4045948.1 hypothetical protein PC123_g18658 [Phytophthora cactorum]KAG4230871.1 hypothetical protein PC116_g20847 [Phytophthora cactorum]